MCKIFIFFKIEDTLYSENEDFEPRVGSRVFDAWSHRDCGESMPFLTYMNGIWFNIRNSKKKYTERTRHGHGTITIRTHTNPVGLKVIISTVISQHSLQIFCLILKNLKL
jgi:hypothetical protein